MVPILNRLGLAAMTGHWDFAYGPEVLQKRVNELDYPFLAANVYHNSDGSLVFPPCRRVSIGSLRVGIIGLACNIVDKTMPPHFSEGIHFTDGTEELPRYIEQMRQREKVDALILLSHLGLPQDLDLLEGTPGIDICLSSHTHNRLSKPIMVGKTIVIQSGCHGSFLGKLHLRAKQGGFALIEHQLIPIEESIPEDEEVRMLVEDAMRPFRPELQIQAGSTPIDLNRATMLESTSDNLVLDAMLLASSAELAFANGWRYGAPISVGKITVNDLYNLAPMNPEIMTVQLTGGDIWKMIEQNLERTFCRDAFGQMGGYVKRCAGMTTFFKVENPAGSRVQSIFVGDSPIDLARTYHAAYITVQAVPDSFGTNRVHTGIHLIDALEQFLEHNAPSPLRGSFVEV
jgi:2',3'-cyclic-nucleotide 2'-phosphodiesterase (5'-nucleotidase family)